jgi:hypothetical protein
MEVKKVFALASVTVLAGFVTAATSAGCSSTTEVVDPGDAATDAPKKEGGTKDGDVDPVTPEEKTVGKLCKSDADCEVAGSVGDNVCSIGFFVIGDLYGDPVCVSQCKRGPGQTFGDILCDGDDQGAPGVCSANNPGEMGVCFPLCEFSSTKIETECQGSNKCTAAYFGTANDGAVFSLGICLGNCKADADCKGTPGSKCQTEIGLCATTKTYVTYTKTIGQGCDSSPTVDQCNCNTVGGTGPNAKFGYCTLSCLTGAAGDAQCNTAKTGWKCSAGLPTTFTDGKPAFTAQPDGVLGGCVLPCTADADCAPIKTAIEGVPGAVALSPAVKCEDTAGFKICVAPSK